MVCPHVRFQFALKQGTKECINMCARNCKWHLCNYTVRVYIYIYLFIYILVTCKYQILLVWLWFDLISELTYAYVHLCHLSLCVRCIWHDISIRNHLWDIAFAHSYDILAIIQSFDPPTGPKMSRAPLRNHLLWCQMYAVSVELIEACASMDSDLSI
jgi:hypothetical protein